MKTIKTILLSFIAVICFTAYANAQVPTRCVTVANPGNICPPPIQLKVCLNYTLCSCPEHYCCAQYIVCHDIAEGQTYCFELPLGAQVMETWVYKITYVGGEREDVGPEVYGEYFTTTQGHSSFELCPGYALLFSQDEDGDTIIRP